MRCGIICIIFITTGISALEWVRLNTTCFQLDEQKVPYKRAVEICKERGVVLHSVQNDWEMSAFKSLLKEKADYWVASSEVNGKFKWGDGRDCCPKSWWGANEPGSSDDCARLYLGDGELLLWGRECSAPFGLMCSKPATKGFARANITDQLFNDLCGVELMPNCEDLPCEDVCRSHHDCDQFAKMLNVCVNMKNVAQTNNCVVKMRTSMEIYQPVWKC